MARIFSEDFGTFTAAGFAPSPATGQLDSDVWRVNGFSDAVDPAYGFTSTSGDLARGTIAATSNPSTGGVYAPAAGVGSGPALVVQPTGGEFDSNGFIEARIVNASGTTITDYTVDFDWVSRNNGDRGSNLAFSYSTDGVTFTTVSAAAFSSPTTTATGATFALSGVDAIAISGVAVENGEALILRWTHVNSTGGGNRDEVGIDNVTVDTTDAPATGAVLSVAATDAAQAEGDAGTTAFTFTVTRTGDTTIAASADYTVAGSGANPADAADFAGPLSGTVSFAAGETTRTITVEVAGDDTVEPDETFTATLSSPSADVAIGSAAASGTILADDRAVTLISAIQGDATTQTNDGFGDPAGSPLRGQTVTVEAIVVGDFQDGDADGARNLRGFYIQEELTDEDGNSLTSEGIFVYEGTGTFLTDFSIGDRVQITGTVEENFGLTRINVSGANGSALLLEAGAVADVDTMAKVVTLPSADTTLSQNGDVQPDLEAYEGMLVTFENTLTITEQFQLDRFNEIKLFDTNGFTQTGPGGTTITGERPFTFTQYNTPSFTGLSAYNEAVGARTITYDDGLNTQNNPIGLLDGFQGYSDATAPSMGDTVTGLTGILDYQFAGNSASGSTWRVRSVEDGANTFEDTNPRIDTPVVAEGNLKVASFNVLNFFTTVDNGSNTIENGMEPRGATSEAELQRQLDKLVTAIEALDVDVLGLVEIENDFIDAAGETTPIGTLVAALNASAGANVWAYVDPGVDQLGGDAIAVATIYRTDVVRIADGTTVATLDDSSPEAQAVIAASNGGTDAIFNGAGASRQPLAVTFEEIASGEEITVVVNHFKSKGSAGPADGDADAGDGQGFSNESRLNAAKALEAWLDGNPTGSTTENVLILGDLNSYAAEDPIQYLLDNGFVDVAAEFLDQAYSYLFDGLLGTLDYALASVELFNKIVSAVEAHLNSDEADALDYNTDFGRDPDYFDDETPFRVSDHDPVVVGINLEETPVANFKLQILHQSDGEAGLLAPDTAPNLAALVDAFENEYANTLVLSSGDNFIPGPFGAAGTDPSLSAVLGGTTAFFRPDIAMQNAIGVEVSAIGNHEWDLGSNVYNDALTANGAFPGANFALVSANLDVSADTAIRGRADVSLGGTAGDLAGSEASTIKGRIVPWTTVTEGGEKIGILGATTQVLERISSPTGTEIKGFPLAGEAGDNAVEADNMDLLASQLQPIIDEMIASGINKIILQTHLQDLNNERLLATKLSGVDIILAGGSNTRLGDETDVPASFPGHEADFADTYPLVTQGLDGKTTLIVNTDGEYTYLGRLVVEFDAAGNIVLNSIDPEVSGAYAATEENVAKAWNDLDGDLSDTAFAEGTRGETVGDIAGAVEAVLLAKDGNIFGYTDVYLEGERSQVRGQETNLGNLTADANANSAREALGAAQPFVVSLKNGGGIRAQIGAVSNNGGDPVKLPPAANPDAGKPEGAISQLDIENALRFDNKLMVFDTTAQELLNILDYAAGRPNNNGGFPQIGGVQYSYDEGAASGSRVKNVALIDDEGNIIARVVENGQISAEAPALISVVTLNFQAQGGDGYPIKANGSNFRYLLNDGTLSAPLDEALDFSASANVPANALGEQQALAEYLTANYGTPETAFDKADTPEAQDTRIQNLDLRADAIFDGGSTSGTTGNDSLVAGLGDDTVYAGLGDDTVFASAGNDTVFGGAGADKLFGGSGNDRLEGQDGDDILRGEDGDDRLLGGAGKDNLDGGAGADNLSGDDGDDTLNGGAGDDTMSGGDGLDYLFGGTGNDFLSGGEGDDTLDGADGDDNVHGGNGNDKLQGKAGNDFLSGGAGDDTLQGGAGNDQLVGGTGRNTLYGDAGDDILVGGSGVDTLQGGDGADTLFGNTGRDFLYGGAGSDVFEFRSAADTGIGASVRDRIFDWASGDRIDLSAIDADATGGTANDAFAFVGGAAFSAAGQVRFFADAGGNTIVQANLDDNFATAEFEIELNRTVVSLSEADFAL